MIALRRALAVIAALALVVPAAAAAQEAARWCVEPRHDEPLLADADRLLNATDAEWKRHRTSFGLGSASPVATVRDEAVCRTASSAYWSILRRAVPDQFGQHPDTPVLTVQVGTVHLVDDRRSREGPDAYWEVMIFDASWRRLTAYGAGSGPAEPRPGEVAALPMSTSAPGTGHRWTGAHAVSGWLQQAAIRERNRMHVSAPFAHSGSPRLRQAGQPRRSWIGRHPVLFGSLVGFGAGFVIGFLPGDDAVFDDFTGEFNGVLVGGIGAGAGAVVGAIVAATRK